MKVNKRSRLKKLAANILFDIIGGFFYSTGIYIFAKNSGFAPGGLSGLALIINHLWRLPIGLTTLILNIPLIIFSFKFLGKSFLIKSVRSSVDGGVVKEFNPEVIEKVDMDDEVINAVNKV